MKEALRVRKIQVGGMRQVGFLAAAGLYALDNHFERLSEDHTKAIEIREVLAKFASIRKVEPIETNIIIFELNDDMEETEFLNGLKEKHIHIIGMGSNKLRMVTHFDYTDQIYVKLSRTLRKLYC